MRPTFPRWFLFATLALFPGCTGSVESSGTELPPGSNTVGGRPSGPNNPTGPVGPSTPTLPVAPAVPDFKPAPLSWQRLTTEQLHNTVLDVFGPDVPFAEIEPDQAVNGFANVGGSKVAISTKGVERLQEFAFVAAKATMSDPQRRARWVKCTPTAANVRSCTEETFKKLGRVLYRRPVEVDTLKGVVAVTEQATQLFGDAWVGMEYGLASLIQSPRFLYALELPERALNVGQVGRLDGYTIAARLALFLTNSSPDEALLDAAAAGELGTSAGVKKHADRLMQSPRFRESLRSFFAANFELEKVRGRAFDKAVFPKATETLGNSALDETMRFLEHHLLDKNVDYREAFVSNTTFVNKELAAVYGVPAPAGTGFAEVTLPDSANRMGLLTQIAFLAAASPPNDANTIVRGRAVREALLCQHIPDPPADLNAQLPPVVKGQAVTKRERLAAHRTDPACAGCHKVMDPPGLALENYDGIGAYRTTDMGLPIDTSGDLDGVKFSDARSFIKAVKEHPALTSCLVRKLYRFATARLESDGQDPLIDALTKGFDQGGRKFAPLVATLVAHDAFVQVTMPPR